jgi:hypothetical protein
VSGHAAETSPLDEFTEGLREAVDAVRAQLTGDGPALIRLIRDTAHPRATLLMSTAIVTHLIEQPRLTAGQQIELLDGVHAALVEHLLVCGPLGETPDIDAALGAIFREGDGANG